MLRSALFSRRSVVLTSATLKLGGRFDSIAGALGLGGDDAPEWAGIDVGGPFSYDQQGILYVARHLPAPGRDGISAAVLTELAELVAAAGGRTLGLFSSRRAAEAAAAALGSTAGSPRALSGRGRDGRAGSGALRLTHGPAVRDIGLWQGVDVQVRRYSLS